AIGKACAETPSCYGSITPFDWIGLAEASIDSNIANDYCDEQSTTSTTTTTQCLAPGVSVGGFCWYRGDVGQSCDKVCANQGKVYDPATKSYAGSDGSDAHCAAVASALGMYAFAADVNYGGLGCGDQPSVFSSGRDLDPTTSNGSNSLIRRACACTQ